MDLICFSHLRWFFVYQRPQHLMTRFAKNQRVFFVEEPVRVEDQPALEVAPVGKSLWRVLPKLPMNVALADEPAILHGMMQELLKTYSIQSWIAWYYTPAMLGFTRRLKPKFIVYDCMDELSAFKNAPAELKDLEREMFARADLVFTGGYSLYQAKKEWHPRVYPFPSSIDFDHFATARNLSVDPTDQAQIPTPRLGFFGVIDERMDLQLLAEIADLKPEWQIVMVGPVVKIDPGELPQRPNIHYLGMKSYEELPGYLAGWDVALLTFAQNESTRFISPTKTPEYLAGGKPVVSSPIVDVVHPYGEQGLVSIAVDANQFVHAIQDALQLNEAKNTWLQRVDTFLAGLSWDDTHRQMEALIGAGLKRRSRVRARLAE